MRIGILGLGNVGAGLVRLLGERREELAGAGGEELSVTAVLVRDPRKPRTVWAGSALVTTDPAGVLENPAVDCVVEAVGGEEPAHRWALQAIRGGRDVVTANKTLVARHGPALRRAAAAAGVEFRFEAAVGAAVPVVRVLDEALRGQQVDEVYGVFNGTTNYVLSRMEQGASAAGALAEAQRLGYAEADPRRDLDGTDAAEKLVILAWLAFGRLMRVGAVPREGIGALDSAGLVAARAAGRRIRLIARAQAGDGMPALRVGPEELPADDPAARVEDVDNAFVVRGAFGRLVLAGPGAGPEATASALAGDLIEVARRRRGAAARREEEQKRA